MERLSQRKASIAFDDRASSVGPFDDRLAFNGLTQKSVRGSDGDEEGVRRDFTANGSLDKDAIEDV